MSIVFMNDYEIIDAINSEDEYGGPIDDEDLTGEEWREICAARGRHYKDVDPEAWRMLCARHGKNLYRYWYYRSHHRAYRRYYYTS